jgi:hypothetical protein
MNCCGRQRSFAAGSGQAVDRVLQPAAMIRYLGCSEIILRGNISGQRYRFSRDAPVQRVALRDCEALLRSGLFRTA